MRSVSSAADFIACSGARLWSAVEGWGKALKLRECASRLRLSVSLEHSRKLAAASGPCPGCLDSLWTLAVSELGRHRCRGLCRSAGPSEALIFTSTASRPVIWVTIRARQVSTRIDGLVFVGLMSNPLSQAKTSPFDVNRFSGTWPFHTRPSLTIVMSNKRMKA